MIIFCKLLNFKECVKAPGIHLFPGDFVDVNSVLSNTQIKFETIFNDNLRNKFLLIFIIILFYFRSIRFYNVSCISSRIVR